MNEKHVPVLLARANSFLIIFLLRQSALLLGNLLGGIYFITLIIHWFIKDRIDDLAVVFYMTPLPVLAVLGFLVAGIHQLNRQNRLAKVTLAFASMCLVAWPVQSLSVSSATHAAGQVRLFFSNTANYKDTNQKVEFIRQDDADIIGLVESGIKERHQSQWQAAFPDHQVAFLRKQMLVMTKGEIISQESGTLNRRGYYHLLKIALRGEQFTLLLVDVDADPMRSRAVVFEPLQKLIRAHAQEKLIVMGDFNTPLQSTYFEPFREHLYQAFETSGSGLAETWPQPVPLLTIDHIWVSRKFEVDHCDLIWSPFSDHRAVAARIDFPISEELVSKIE